MKLVAWLTRNPAPFRLGSSTPIGRDQCSRPETASTTTGSLPGKLPPASAPTTATGRAIKGVGENEELPPQKLALCGPGRLV